MKSGVLHLTDTAPKILWAYIKENKLPYITAITMMLLATLANVQIPPLIGQFAAAYEAGALTPGVPLHYALRIGGWALLYVALHWTAIFLVHSRARNFEYYLRNRLFTHWVSLSQSYYTHESVGNLMAYATNDVQAIRSSISMGLNQLTNATFMLIVTISAMIGTVSWDLALYSLLPLPLVTVLIAMLRPRIRHRFRLLQEGFATLSERTQESLSGIRVVKAYVQEEHEMEKFDRAAIDIVNRGYALTIVSALIHPSIQLVGGISFLIALGYGAVRVIEGTTAFGDLITFMGYLGMLVNPMRQLGSVIDVSQRAGAALHRLTKLLQERPAVRNAAAPVPLNQVQGELRFENLTFRYPYASQPVLSDIHLTIPAGTTVAFVGRTAFGKTTLANLLLRVFEPPRGTIFIDGIDIRDADLDTLRRQISYVPQDVFLFSTTIADNVAFGVERIDMDRVEQASQHAQVYGDIMELPNAFDTKLGERGIGLSGGQRQRVAIARALIKDSPVLILDDSLSAVDTKTETAILDELRKLRGRQTLIIIAHRISAVRDADLIVVLEQGRIVEQGTHDELLARQGAYYDIYELQRKGTATIEPKEQTGGEDDDGYRAGEVVYD